jgi:hypothetical protein
VSLPQLAVVTLYDIVLVPAATPVTTPVEETVADALEALHTPPDEPEPVTVMELPAQRNERPVIVPASGRGTTLIILDARTGLGEAHTALEVSIAVTVSPLTGT